MSQQGEEVGKLFVGGLSWETTQESLCRFFSRFGEVIDCVVMKNNETGRSRGFGFVTFKDPSCVQVVLSSGPHQLDGRTIDPKACNPRSMQKSGEHKQKNKGNHPKIFLGGLPSNITETDLRNFFGKYGKVLEVVIMYDQEKKRSRGFGFLSYETEDSVDQVCAEHYVTINGKQVECKKAEPRDGRTISAKQGGQWNGAGMNMAMGPGGMPPPPMGGPPMGAPGMGPPAMGPIPNGMPGSMMSSAYQSAGWGTPQQQAGYGPQGYGAPPPGSYQGWGPAQGTAYSPYGTAGPQYAATPQGAYPGYGAAYPGYASWNSPPPSAPAGTPSTIPGALAGQDPYTAQAQVTATTTAATAQLTTQVTTAVSGQGTTTTTTTSQPGLKQEYNNFSATCGTMGSYPQEASSFGPARTYSSGVGQDGMQNSDYSPSGGQTAQGYGQGDGPTNNYSGSQGTNYIRSGTQTQGYHPYRRQ